MRARACCSRRWRSLRLALAYRSWVYRPWAFRCCLGVETPVPEALIVGRVCGAGLLALGVACWLSRVTIRSRAQDGLVWGNARLTTSGRAACWRLQGSGPPDGRCRALACGGTARRPDDLVCAEPTGLGCQLNVRMSPATAGRRWRATVRYFLLFFFGRASSSLRRLSRLRGLLPAGAAAGVRLTSSSVSFGSAAMHSASVDAVLLADHVRALHERHHLIERVPASHALAAHAAVGRQHQALDRDVLQRHANVVRDFRRASRPGASGGR